MNIKRYRTQRGAEGFRKQLRARWPHKLFQVTSFVGLDFVTYWFVEVMIENGDSAYWVGVGPMTTKGEANG